VDIEFFVEVCVELVHIVWISQHYVIVNIGRMASVCCGGHYRYRKSERNLNMGQKFTKNQYQLAAPYYSLFFISPLFTCFHLI